MSAPHPRTSRPVEGFTLAYDHTGTGPAVVLLHGWPGDRHDFDDVAERLRSSAEVVVPDLRGFGGSDKHALDPARYYSAEAQARSVAGLIDELGLHRPVVAGYDVGSRVAQALARHHPDQVGTLVLTPPLPGVGRRILSARSHDEFWYQGFHRSGLLERVVDGRPDQVRAYLAHFWDRWSGSAYALPPRRLDRLVASYGVPGALTASVAYYRAGSGTVATSLAESTGTPGPPITTPTTVLWPEDDVLFPLEWADRLSEFFTDVALRPVAGSGHFVATERPDAFAAAITASMSASVSAP